jgi:lysophospholipase L1-like esterase
MHRPALVLAAFVCAAVSATAQTIKYDFGPGTAPSGWTKVTPDLTYTDDRGFGFEGVPASGLATFKTGNDPLKGDGVKADAPFFFTFKVPSEGNWRVTVTLGGDPAAASLTTINAEIRRLMVLHAATKPGESKTVSFLVNTRTAKIPDGTVVRLKPRETQGEAIAWDDRIQLEFNDAHPAISSLTAERVDNVPTIYLIGDSTMTDQPGMPTTSWGQFLPIFFKNTVAIANHGESGEAYSAFRGERRLAKLLSVIKPGDWVISQFGHNDEKERERGETFGAFKNYATEMRNYTNEIRAKGAHIILVTPMQRHSFADGKTKNTHDDYPDAVRAVAKELDVPMIDLTAMSDKMLNAMGEKPAWLLFSRGSDATHHSPYGAWELAKCIAQGIKDSKAEPAKWLADDFKGFDPSKPDSIESYTVPESPRRAGAGGAGAPAAAPGAPAPKADDASKPYGN